MRTRIRLTSAAIGAALLVGGAAATVQAAPASAHTATASCSPELTWPGITYLCRTHRDCEETAKSLGYEEWFCRSLPSGWWRLYVDV